MGTRAVRGFVFGPIGFAATPAVIRAESARKRPAPRWEPMIEKGGHGANYQPKPGTVVIDTLAMNYGRDLGMTIFLSNNWRQGLYCNEFSALSPADQRKVRALMHAKLIDWGAEAQTRPHRADGPQDGTRA